MWQKLANWPWYGRGVVKLCLFLLVLGVVLFPNPYYLVRHIMHLADTESLIQPDKPFIAGINLDINSKLPKDATRDQELKAVERYVYKTIAYAYDWELWSNVDYWPTATEVWERRREDCDGRAVLTASILRARGFKDAKIVGNISHVWVEAGGKGLMGAEKDKNFTRVNGKVVIKMPQFGTVLEGLAQVRFFPIWRLAVLVLAAVLLALHPCRSWRRFGVGAAAGCFGLAMLYAWAARTGHGHGAMSFLWLSAGLFLTAVLQALFARTETTGNHAMTAAPVSAAVSRTGTD